MLGAIVILSMIFVAIIVPLLAIRKYYSPKQFSLFENILWIIVAIITWPLMPIVLVMRHKDKLLLSMFWISFLILVVSLWYWMVLNVNALINFQQMLQMR